MFGTDATGCFAAASATERELRNFIVGELHAHRDGDMFFVVETPGETFQKFRIVTKLEVPWSPWKTSHKSKEPCRPACSPASQPQFDPESEFVVELQHLLLRKSEPFGVVCSKIGRESKYSTSDKHRRPCVSLSS